MQIVDYHLGEEGPIWGNIIAIQETLLRNYVILMILLPLYHPYLNPSRIGVSCKDYLGKEYDINFFLWLILLMQFRSQWVILTLPMWTNFTNIVGI